MTQGANAVRSRWPAVLPLRTGPGLTGNSTGGIIPWTPKPGQRRDGRSSTARSTAKSGNAPYYARPGEYIDLRLRFPRRPSFRYSLPS